MARTGQLRSSMFMVAIVMGLVIAGCGDDDGNTTGSPGSTGTGGGGGGQGGAGGAGGAGAGGGGGGQGGAGGEACVPEAEVCDGADNDCDRQVDEGCACTPGDTQSCYEGDPPTQGVGQCADGTQTCGADGQWGPCEGQVLPSPEQCDGEDDDCNGTPDDGVPEVGMACPTGQPGACAAGTQACTGGALSCVPDASPSPETCDSIDNDCNGQPDDGDPGGGVACDTGNPGACAAGTTACVGGAVVCNQDAQPSPEVCDSIDNDCNGQPDDGNPGGGVACNTGNPGPCAAGMTACTAGAIQCVQAAQPALETCDAIDNNCNGQVDEVNATGPTGTCAHNKCVTGALLDAACDTCVATICATDAYCCTDAWDSLCVFEVEDLCDVDCTGTCAGTGQGVCASGTEVCTNGALTCNVPQASPETCDGLDNDCNGQTDDIPEVCADGVDNDCDGLVDAYCTCAHSACLVGAALLPTCDPCVDLICEDDPFCCLSTWDSFCVSEMQTVCGMTCP